LKPKKNDGGSGLTKNYFRYADAHLFVHIALLFSGLLIHGTVPKDFLASTIIPIPKRNNTNLADASNYRGITLGFIYCRIFDLIILDRYIDSFVTSDLQFGSKRRCSTSACTMVLKEVVSYYSSNHSNVRCVFLDATKAFDRVEYCKLFRLLLKSAIHRYVIRLLIDMYTGQQVRVLWNGIFSSNFRITKGVKQRGMTSPVPFSIYFDVLLTRLRDSNVGCFIGPWFTGALAYADNLAILAPTAKAMRMMLAICDEYADEYCVRFNANKSKCIYFANVKTNSSLYMAEFSICGHTIENVDSWPHLGHIITSDQDDAKDIQSRCRSTIGQINKVVCCFSHLDSNVAKLLHHSGGQNFKMLLLC
jgi:hypothetical protein